MKPLELVVLSGKGGTGKTTVAAGLAVIANTEGISMVLADCDVDAPNLGLMLPVALRTADPFTGGEIAEIDLDRCTQCGLCRDNCQFEAVSADFVVDIYVCEGCGVCSLVCPSDAATMHPDVCGNVGVGETSAGPLVDAALLPGRGNSGKLVAAVRQRAREVAEAEEAFVILADGPPGLGCSVISTLTGADLALLVTEPSSSGTHDLARTMELCGQLNVPCVVAINKSDLNARGQQALERLCAGYDVELLGRLPFDAGFARRLAAGQPLTQGDIPAYEPIGLAMRDLWTRLITRLREMAPA